MQTHLKHCIVLLLAFVAAPVVAQDGGPNVPLQENPLPFLPDGVEFDDEGMDDELEFMEEDDDLSVIDEFEDSLEEEAPAEDASVETKEVSVGNAAAPPRNAAPPANPIPGLISSPSESEFAPAEVKDPEPADSPLQQQTPKVTTPASKSPEQSGEEPSGDQVNPPNIDPNAPIEIVQERYSSGNVKIRREMTLDLDGNYVKHGQWTMYSEAGEEIAGGKFVANERDGSWYKQIAWGESPVLNTPPYPDYEVPFRSEATFKQGQLVGVWKISDNQGRVISEWSYRNGKLHGQAKWFYPDGSVRESIEYDDGLLNGAWTIVDKSGKELQADTYVKGRKYASKQETYENGTLKWDGMFLHETFVVNTPDDWWNTRPVSYKPVGEPERHGEFTSWYENGQKKFSGNFEHEVRSGEFTWWHPNTQVAVKGNFVDGERNGLWVWWHENGQKAIQGTYETGKLKGPWSYWAPDGKLERKVDYNDQNQPTAWNAFPGTKIRVRRDAPRSAADEPVGTGLRMATKPRIRVATQFETEGP